MILNLFLANDASLHLLAHPKYTGAEIIFIQSAVYLTFHFAVVKLKINIYILF